MRDIDSKKITETVARLCQEANFYLGEDVLDSLKQVMDKEEAPLGRQVLEQILENASIAAKEKIPLCQDTGITVVYLWLGQDAHIVGGDLYDAVQEGVRQGYRQGYLRNSIVTRPFSARVNTNDNTPAMIHAEIVSGDNLRIVVMPKGEGSENTSRLTMLNPADGRQGVIDFVVRTVEEAGSDPCPPVIVGLGIGGTTGRVMILAKMALLRKVGEPNPDPEVAELEREILERVNRLGIGPQGFGGSTTALAVHAAVIPCHMSALPVAVNMQCHAARYKEAVL
ncbi:MAG: fumarate hydratase [Dehalococcoidia bacterium]|nr:fumarate hydratase [Dehalococcoidia bacterium]